tara:strand:- start:198 stop:404 length:207 start_codon:yes stop_codon:yes gene_type:complete
MGSGNFKLNGAEIVGVLKTGLLVGAAAGLAFVSESLINIDLGALGPLVVPVITVGLQSVITWIRDNTK